uniref:Uncharacterized protein n=1 Tax=Plectus sambesii TaxID=2011161 RepID=A0A914W6W1_9BILA
MYTIFDQATQQAMSIKRSSDLDLEAEENGEASQKSTTKRAKVYYPATMSGEIIDKPPSGTPADEDCLTTVVDS